MSNPEGSGNRQDPLKPGAPSRFENWPRRVAHYHDSQQAGFEQESNQSSQEHLHYGLSTHFHKVAENFDILHRHGTLQPPSQYKAYDPSAAWKAQKQDAQGIVDSETIAERRRLVEGQPAPRPERHMAIPDYLLQGQMKRLAIDDKGETSGGKRGG